MKVKITEDKLRKIINESVKKYLVNISKVKEPKHKTNVASTPLECNPKDILSGVREPVDQLDESLMMSYDVDDAVKILCRKFGIHESRAVINDGSVVLFLPSTVDGNFIGDVKHFMNYCGFYMPSKEASYNGALDCKVLTFIPKFPKEDVTEEIINNYRYLYHATPSLYTERILKYGLIPKAKNNVFMYPERVHLSTKCDDTLFNSLKAVLGMNKKYKGTTFDVLQIDVRKLQQNIKFFKDPDYNSGVYTYDNISPQAIKVIINGKDIDEK